MADDVDWHRSVGDAPRLDSEPARSGAPQMLLLPAFVVNVGMCQLATQQFALPYRFAIPSADMTFAEVIAEVVGEHGRR